MHTCVHRCECVCGREGAFFSVSCIRNTQLGNMSPYLLCKFKLLLRKACILGTGDTVKKKSACVSVVWLCGNLLQVHVSVIPGTSLFIYEDLGTVIKFFKNECVRPGTDYHKIS